VAQQKGQTNEGREAHMLLALADANDKARATRAGGIVIGHYPNGWLVDVEAARIGEVSYRLGDGTVIRLYRCPRAISYPDGYPYCCGTREPVVEWDPPSGRDDKGEVVVLSPQIRAISVGGRPRRRGDVPLDMSPTTLPV
jgi:hypothetical protein